MGRDAGSPALHVHTSAKKERLGGIFMTSQSMPFLEQRLAFACSHITRTQLRLFDSTHFISASRKGVKSAFCISYKSAESLYSFVPLGPRLFKTRGFHSTRRRSNSEFNFKSPYLHRLCPSNLISQPHLCVNKWFTF